MRICVVGKYPPIEGGVSSSTYWLTRGLAHQGHEVHVVTNADEVEEAYRLALRPGDAAWYQPNFVASGGRVRVHGVEAFSPVRMRHIPLANPFVSRLAACATDVVRAFDCDVILAYYLEPYAVAGWMAATWTARPLVVRHAGSDLDRLFQVPDLATTYREVIRAADLVVTRPGLVPRFLGLGVSRDRICPDVPYALPKDVFHPAAAPLDLADVAVDPGWPEVGPVSTTPPDAVVEPGPDRPPVIGVYGKVGPAKGTFDLVSALGRLATEDVPFTFAAMIGVQQADRIRAAVTDAGLRDRTRIVPYLPNWRVPGFIRACTAVCFLERDFPVAIHGPIVPREILACGTCLVLSGEIAAKQGYRKELVSGRNVLLVEDPRDLDALVAALRTVLTEPRAAHGIGAGGRLLSDTIEDYPGHVRFWTDLLGRVAGQAGAADPSPPASPAEGYLNLIPAGLVDYLTRRSPRLVESFEAAVAESPGAGAESPAARAIRFCEYAITDPHLDVPEGHRAAVRDILRYQRTRLLTGHEPYAPAGPENGSGSANGSGWTTGSGSAPGHLPPFLVTDQLGGRTVTEESVGRLRPVRNNRIRIESFEHLVTELLAAWTGPGERSAGDQDAAVADLPRGRVEVLFARTANLSPCELSIDSSTRQLVALCDGTRTTRELVVELCRRFDIAPEGGVSKLMPQVLAALARLYQLQVVVFGAYRSGWGWAGGERSAQRTVPPVDR